MRQLNAAPSWGVRYAGRAVVALALLTATTVTGTAAAERTGTAANATVTVRIVPDSVTAGQPALAAVILQNTGGETLPNAVVTLAFPSELTVASTPGCERVNGSASSITCKLGDVARGATARAYVNTLVASQPPPKAPTRVWFSLRIGPGVPPPIFISATTIVLASSDATNRGSCHAMPAPLTATLGGQSVTISSPPLVDPSLAAPCTPLGVSIQPLAGFEGFRTDLAAAQVPRLVHPATVELTFPAGRLPDESQIDNLPAGARPSFANPNPLWELYPFRTLIHTVVPRCAAGPAIPPGHDSCIVRIDATGPSYDAGTITLLVQGTGLGDPRFAG